jgi:hypothetical protein
MLDNFFVGILSLVLILAFLGLTAAILLLHKEPFSVRFDGLLFAILPAIVGFVYIFCFCYFEGNFIALVFIIYPITGLLLFLAMWWTDTFYPVKLRVPMLLQNHYDLTLANFRRLVGYAKFYDLSEYGMTVNMLVKKIDKEGRMNRVEADFKDEKEWKHFQEIQIRYETWKKEVSTWKVACLGWFHASALIRHRYKRVFYIHKHELAEIRQIVGSGDRFDDRVEIDGKLFDTYYIFAGLPCREPLDYPEGVRCVMDMANIARADIENDAMKAENATLRNINADLMDQLTTQRSLYREAYEATHGRQPEAPPEADGTKAKEKRTNILFAILIIMLIAFLCLFGFGVIG